MRERTRIARKKETASEVPPIVQEVLSSSGQPLNADTRDFMEPRFGHDFSQVRVHTDERAVESAEAVNALAYTVGQDVVFGEGQYAPETGEGKRLVAHELTHVAQQGFTKAQGNFSFTQTEDRFEQEANRMGGLLIDEPEAFLLVKQAINPAHMYTQSEPRIARRKDNETDTSNQHDMGTSNRDAMINEMEIDLRLNSNSFIEGLHSAALRFNAEVLSQLEAEHVQNQAQLLSIWGNYLGSFATPVIAPVVGLNPVGVALMLGTMALLIDSSSIAPESTTAQKQKAILDYFIGPSKSVASEVSRIETRSAAEKGFDRHRNLIATDTQENRMNLRRAFQQDLFQMNILEGYVVKEHLVDKHASDQILRLWNLTTVTERAQSALNAKHFFALPDADSVDAFIDKVQELFPDFLDKMQTIMPARYKYWMDQRGGRLTAKDITMFRRDIEDLALTTRRQEFGVPGGVLPYSTIGPAR